MNFIPVDELDPKLVILYRKKDSSVLDKEYEIPIYDQVVHLSKSDPSKCHIYHGFNQFCREESDLPSIQDGWKKIKITKNLLDRTCNPSAKCFTEDDCIDFQKLYPVESWKYGRIYFNGGYCFIYFINMQNNEIKVYTRDNEKIIRDSVEDQLYQKYDDPFFNRLVLDCIPIEVFIGINELNEFTEHNESYDPRCLENTLLVRIGDKSEYRYIYFGAEMVEFVVDEKITSYHSPIGCSLVPYPYAESENYCYCMLNFKRTPSALLPDRKKKGYILVFADETEPAVYESFYHRIIISNWDAGSIHEYTNLITQISNNEN